MDGKSHVAFNATSAIVLSSAFHLAGEPFTWSQFVLLTTNPVLMASSIVSPVCTHKVLYYILVVFGALLPDIDHPGSTLGRRCRWLSQTINKWFGHRTLTHSLFGLGMLFLLLTGLGGCIYLLLTACGVHMTSAVIGNALLAFFWVLLGCALHIVADGLTSAGVPVLWPVPGRYGIIPIASLRFKVGTWAEHVFLWVMLFSVGIGIGAGALGF